MSDELRAWLKGVKERRDRALTEFGDDHAFADVALDCVNADIPDLIAKVEELAGAIGECDEILDNMDVDFEASAYIAEVRTTLRAALRAPGGGEG